MKIAVAIGLVVLAPFGAAIIGGLIAGLIEQVTDPNIRTVNEASEPLGWALGIAVYATAAWRIYGWTTTRLAAKA